MKLQDLLAEISYPHANIDDSLHHVREVMLREKLDFLPILDDKGYIFGLIDGKVLAESYLATQTEAAQNIWEICDRDFKVVNPAATIQEVVLAMQETGSSFVMVADEGRYTGAITAAYLVTKITIADDEGSTTVAAVIAN